MQAADAVAHGRAVKALAALHRPAVDREDHRLALRQAHHLGARLHARPLLGQHELAAAEVGRRIAEQERSEEHTSELQSLMRTSYAVFCLKKKKLTTESTDVPVRTKEQKTTRVPCNKYLKTQLAIRQLQHE